MSKRIYLIILLVISVCVLTEAATYIPTDDTFIDEWLPDTISGSQPHMIVRNMNLAGFELDSLLKFDLSSISSGAMVNSATLNLYYYHYNNDNPSGNPLDVCRITGSWSESTTKWTNRPAYDSTATSTVSGPGSYGWIQWDVRSDVQDFVDGLKTNYGWQLMDDSVSSDAMIYFHSKEYSDSNYSPYLEVEYGTIYVDANATGANNGASWADALTKLQDALSTAVSGEKIWVADGIYKPDAGGGATPNDANATFQLINGVQLYGGFAGGETDLEQRDWENNIAILSGDIGAAENDSDNSYHVVTGSSTNSTALIDGFTITQSNARGSGPTRSGGGMYNYQGSPTVTNCTFVDNMAQFYGGGMYNDYNSDPNVFKCTFSENTAEYGGGMANNGGSMADSGSSPIIINCFFKDNDANIGNGGGMHNDRASNPLLINCVFVNNSADGTGGGIRNRGEEGKDTCPILVNCSFSGNWAGSTGGGMYTYNVEDECHPVMTNCVLWGNTSDSGTVQDAQIDGDSPIVTYSCIQDDDPDDGTIPFGGAANNNIDDDPLFENASSGNLRLSPGSPCIEAGSDIAVPTDAADLDEDGNTAEPTPLDIDSHPRFTDGDCDGIAIIDMGAYEFAWIYIGDLDGDCDVDFVDFTVIANHWLAGVE